MTLFNALSQISPLSEKCQTALCHCSRIENHKAGRFLLTSGQISNNLYYLESGLARIFYDIDESREITAWFRGEGEFVFSVHSFLLQQPTNEHIELLEDSRVCVISYTDLQQMFIEYPELNHPFRLLYEQYIVVYEKRMELIFERDLVKRYQTFCELYAHITPRLQVKHIAQYLNISQSELSRVRKRLTMNF